MAMDVHSFFFFCPLILSYDNWIRVKMENQVVNDMQNLPIKATTHSSSSSVTSTGWWEEDEAMEVLA